MGKHSRMWVGSRLGGPERAPGERSGKADTAETIDPHDHIGLLFAICLKMARPEDDHRELAGACYHKLVAAAKAYDPTKGTTFSTYAYTAIQRHIWRMQTGGGRVQLRTQRLPDVADRLIGSDEPSRDDINADREQRDHDIARLRTVLTEREFEIITRRVGGEDLVDIGKDLGITRARVQQIEQNAFARARAAFGYPVDGRTSKRGPHTRKLAKPDRRALLYLHGTGGPNPNRRAERAKAAMG